MSDSLLGKTIDGIIEPGVMGARATFEVVHEELCEYPNETGNMYYLLSHKGRAGVTVLALAAAEEGQDDKGGDVPLGLCLTIDRIIDGKANPNVAKTLRALADKIDELYR